MRTAFITTLTKLARENEKVFLLTGDLGFSVFEDFRAEFPDRFFNVGLAEANMVGISAGLSLSGKIVFIYSIVPFVTMRCFEQIRNDLCYQNLNVKIIGTGGGLCYGSAGPTHHSITDIAIMRVLPNMTVICPGDPIEAELAVKSSITYQGPVYIRLGKGHELRVHSTSPHFEIGKGIILKEGSDIVLIATGNMLSTAKQVADMLEGNGLSIRLVSMHTVKPIDKALILKAAKETKAIFTIEEHSIISGLGSAVAEVIAESKHKCLFKRIGLLDIFNKDVGSQEYLREKNSLSVKQILKTILQKFNKVKI